MTREKAIKIVKEFINGTCLHLVDQEALETLIPELKESEDERIIKTLQEYVKNQNWPLNGPTQARVLAWLEKQKELPFVKDVILGYPGIYFYDGERMHFRGNPAMEEKQKERKPTVSREEILHQLFQNGSITLSDYLYLTGEQKPAEWSEEDEKMIDTIVSALGQYIDYKAVSGTGSGYATPRYNKEIDWLKSLRPSWKPSEEQMKALERASTNKYLSAVQYDILVSLYEQLKKLN